MSNPTVSPAATHLLEWVALLLTPGLGPTKARNPMRGTIVRLTFCGEDHRKYITLLVLSSRSVGIRCRDSMKMSSVELNRNVLCKKLSKTRSIGRYERTFDNESEGTGIPESAVAG